MALDQEALRKAEKKTPLLKLYVYATKGGANVDPSPSNSAAVGTLNLDVRTLRRGVRTWSKLRGAAAPAEILVEAAAKRSAPIVERPSEPPAKQLGRGSTTFELCVSLEKAGDLRSSLGGNSKMRPLTLLDLDAGSQRAARVVVQTEQPPPRH